MTYEETIELEENISIKNKANELYSKFMKNMKLDVSTFKNGRFKIWSDSHNAKYIKIVDDTFIYQCSFLHESYTVKVTPEDLFGYIKNDYRGVAHFETDIRG